MTLGWIVVNIIISVAVTALVAGVSILVPLKLHRHALAQDAQARAASRPAWRAWDGDERLEAA
jgi:hypothetical protein